MSNPGENTTLAEEIARLARLNRKHDILCIGVLNALVVGATAAILQSMEAPYANVIEFYQLY